MRSLQPRRARRRFFAKRSGMLLVLCASLLGTGAGCVTENAAEAPRSGAAAPSAEIPFERLWLISVEGLAAEDAGNAERMPFLASLAQRGASAEAVSSVGAPLAYPAHASLVTGRAPDSHGVVADTLLGRRGVRGAPFWHATRVQGASLWQSLLARGVSVASIGWPSTVGAAMPLLVPDLAPLRRGETWLGVLEGSATPSLLAALRSEEGSASMWPEAKVRDAAHARAACAVVEAAADPRLSLLRFVEPAAAQRQHGLSTEAEGRALARVDAHLSKLVGCLEKAGRWKGSALAIVGDRRLESVHTQISPNVLLADAGLLLRDGTSNSGVGTWKALVRATDSLATLHATEDAAALRARDVLTQAASSSGAFRVLSAAALQARRGDPQAWFGLEAEPGYVFSDGADGNWLRPAAQRAAGRGRPGTAFVLVGAGVRSGLRIPVMSQLDVAPTLAQLLGVQLEGAEGRVLVGLLTEKAARYKVRARSKRATGATPK